MGFKPKNTENKRPELTRSRVGSGRSVLSGSEQPARVVLIANTAWNIWNFRRSLVEALIQDGAEVICMAPVDGFEKHLEMMPGVRFMPLHHLSRKSLSPLGNLRTFAELTRLLVREKPDIAVLYTIKPNIFGSIAAKLAGVPAIATIEGLGYVATAPSFFRYFVFLLFRFAFCFARKVVFLNHDDRAGFLYHHTVSPEKSLVIKGAGVDTTHFSPVDNAAPEQIFLFIGRLLTEKGVREFVRAAALVKQVFPQVRFQLLGSPDAGNPASIGPDELRHWIENQHVEYLGQADDVRPHIVRSSVIVLPSYREGIPRALLEGMAMGKPIITTDSVGCRETVDEGRNGFIVPSENAEALAGAMLRFLRLPIAQQEAMGHYSRQKAVLEFSNSFVLPQYIQLIQETLQQRSRSR